MKENCKILVVDDSEENRGAVAELLRVQGYAVLEACNSREALEKKEHFQAQIFLLDVVMPEMNGLKLLEEINVKDNIYEAIMMTGHESLDDAKKAMELGAFSYIGKPIKKEELYDHVNKALSAVKLKQMDLEYKNNLEEKVKERTLELEGTLQIVKNQSRRLDTIINSMGEGLLAIDSEDNIMLINDKAQRILKIRFVECFGQYLWGVLNDEHVNEQLMPIVKNGYQVYSEKNNISIRLENDRANHFLVNVSEIKGDGSESVGKIITFTDQTAKVEAEQLRNSFLTIVSHELRTPLNVLMNYIPLLKIKKSDKKKFEEIIKDMEITGRGLSYLINNIIALSSLSIGTKKLNPEKVNIESLIRSKIEKMKPEATEKKIIINICNKMQNQYIVTDPKILGIAINCLINNAIKFNKQNGLVDIGLEIRKHGGQTYMLVNVIDEGIGIPEKQQDKLFDIFVQGDDPMTRRYHGIGIGLFIVKRGMEILNGKVTVNSVEGEGSRFTLEIPLISN